MSKPIAESGSGQHTPDVAVVLRHVAEIRDPDTNRLLFRVFCDSWQVEIQQRNRKFVVDLRALLTGSACVQVEAPAISTYFERKDADSVAG